MDVAVVEAMVDRIVEALERNAIATEKMLAIAENEQIQFEQGPPICPGCGRPNPTVTQLETGSGPLAEFVMKAETHCCNHVIYAVPVGFSTTLHIENVPGIARMGHG
jgi:hypothetical protein